MSATPWFQRTRRWGQVNLTEDDPATLDVDWWRAHWRRTRVQGVIVNAGGIVAYYPSQVPFHYRAAMLGNRDLFGELTAAARAEGLAVLARMDSNRAEMRLAEAHPDWFTTGADGRTATAGGRAIACIHGPYYREHLPRILEEIIACYRPDGFTDNSWTGAGRKAICHCAHCRNSFHAASGRELPAAPDWDDPAYRAWIRWNYRRREEFWDENNAFTRRLGGPDCLWLGMVHSDPIGGHVMFCDLEKIGRRAPVLMTDQQSRTALGGFEQNALAGKLLHEAAGWDRIISESMALYARGERTFRLASTPAAEARLWMFSGIAGGIAPWWHQVGGGRHDRRQLTVAGPVFEWHEKNERYLFDREPVADAALAWSHDNIDFFGRDDARERVQLPLHGWARALLRARVPFLPVPAARLGEASARFKLLILPNLGAMTVPQAAAIRAFAQAGGAVIATGATGCFDADGQPHASGLLDDLFGIRRLGGEEGGDGSADWETHAAHSYIRLPAPDARHAIFSGLGDTDLVAFGGRLQRVEAAGAETAATWVPPFPIYPPEFSWMRTPATHTPVILARELPGGGRVLFFAGDFDRLAALRGLPDHAAILAGAVAWCLRGRVSVRVAGGGLIDVHLYKQADRRILHLVNLSGANPWPGYHEQPIPVGPILVELPGVASSARARSLVTGREWTGPRLEIPRLEEHDVLVWGD